MSELPPPHTWKEPDLTPHVSIDISHLLNPFVAGVIEETLTAYKDDLSAKVDALPHHLACWVHKSVPHPCTCWHKSVLRLINGSDK